MKRKFLLYWNNGSYLLYVSHIIRLENELKRLKSELHTCSQTEKELRNQLNSALNENSNTSHDLTRLKQEHEDTKSK